MDSPIRLFGKLSGVLAAGQRARFQLLRYGAALLAVTFAFLLTLLLWPLIKPTPILLFIIAVMLSAWYGGLGSSLLAAVISALLVDFLFIPPEYELVPDWGDITRGVSLAAVALFASWLNAARRRTEELLRESEARLRATYEHAAVGVRQVAPDGRLLQVDAKLAEILGYTQAELLERTYADITHPDDLAEEKKHLARLLAGEIASYTIEKRYLRKDGQPVWVRVTSSLAGSLPYRISVVEDITERKQAEESLRQSNERLLMALEAGRMGTWEWNILTGEVKWSENLEKIHGLAPGSFGGTFEGYQKDIHPQDRELVLGALARAVEKGEHLDMEYRIVRPDGTIRWVEGKGTVFEDSCGQAVRMAGVCMDITERKRMGQLLRESEERFRKIFEEGPLGIALVRQDLRIIDVNDALCQMLGYTRRELIGLAFVDITHPEDIEIDVEHTRQLFAGEIPNYKIEKRYIAKNKKVIWMSLTASVIRDKEGKPLYGLDIVENVTERKRAEQALADRLHEIETMMEVLPVGLFIARDRACARIIGNRAAREFLQMDLGTDANLSLSAPPGQAPVHFRVLKDGREIPPEELPVQRAAVEGTAVHNVELDVVFSDGTVKHELISALPLFDQYGVPRGAVASIMDITEQKRAEKEREQLLAREQAARVEAEAANRVKDEFVAVLSHELRTPLSAILGWARLLSSGNLDEATFARALETIQRNAKLQAQMIDDLLDISRIITGKLQLDTRPITLAPIIEAAIDSVQPAADAKNIEIQMMPTYENELVLGDSDRLQQIVWNLLSNAVKFTPDGGRVRVQVKYEPSHARIIVSDTGKGISAEFSPHVFDRFSQADTGSKRRSRGLGLGLAIVRHLVELHGGTVSVESPGEGQGATFTVRLPLMISHRDTSGSKRLFAPAVGHEFPLENSSRLDGLRVLVVDDEPDARKLLTMVLEQCGAQVAAVGSAAEALEAIERSRPDILVSDIAMPNEDGYDLIRKVRMLGLERGGQIPAIALTAYAGPEDRMRALSEGYQRHVPKPVEPAELVAVIASLMRRTE